MSAYRELFTGDWQKAFDFLTSNKKMWSLMIDYQTTGEDGVADVENMLKEKVKETALKVFIQRNGVYYQNIQINTLQTMFELENVDQILSRMIFREGLNAQK